MIFCFVFRSFRSQNEVINLWFHFNLFNIARLYGIYHFVAIRHPFHFERKEVIWIVLFPYFLFLLRLRFSISSLAISYLWLVFRSIRLNGDGNILSFPMSYAMLGTGNRSNVEIKLNMSFHSISSCVYNNELLPFHDKYFCICEMWIDWTGWCTIYVSDVSCSSASASASALFSHHLLII